MGSKKNEKKLEKKAQKFITKNPVPRKFKRKELTILEENDISDNNIKVHDKFADKYKTTL